MKEKPPSKLKKRGDNRSREVRPPTIAPAGNSTRSNLESDLTRKRPSDFMRARRPELFSDSKVITKNRLSRELLEYHLDTLTSRKQETEFEYFCRRLVEKEICPNLRPQTGPTGGGDSKVDAETYPVADAVSDRWYEGDPAEAGQQRWAFAFSAKKDWKPKVTTDVEKIVATKRQYQRIYCISNQFIPDKKRAKLEDDLTKRFKTPITIFDRSWIVERVFRNDRIDIAIQSLSLTQFDSLNRKAIGPRDFEREADLRALEAQIEDPTRYVGVGYQLVEDALRTAILARSLELPRTEIEGRFARAERLAKKTSRRQLLRVIYQKA
jgi:hypothetical protein